MRDEGPTAEGPVPPEDLADCARRAAIGEMAAFAVIVRATQADVWRTCAALVDRDAADDLTQDTFLRAHAAFSRFEGRSSVRTWMISIARHVCLDELRARGRRRRHAQLLPRPGVVSEPAGHVELLVLVGALPADRREAFVLTQLVGLSYAEAADVCGCPLGTIRSRVARARIELVSALSADQSAEA